MTEILFDPSSTMRASPLWRFLEVEGPGLGVRGPDYLALHRASIEQPGAFWRAVARFGGLVGDLGGVDLEGQLPDFSFFPEGRVNYAEEAFARFKDPAAVIGTDERGRVTRIPASEVFARAFGLAKALGERGVALGDRVAGFLPNVPETVMAFLATASLGAVWSCTAPEFGVSAVVDRFAQIEPKVLLAVAEYRFGGRVVDRREALREIVAGLPSLQVVVLVGTGTVALPGVEVVGFDELAATLAEPRFAPVPFNHPLWILYSSGTTGIPKAIVQSHGGIVLEHKKVLELHAGLAEGSVFFWFTSTGWMMWNFLVGGMLVGSSIVTFDGSPAEPSLDRLWGLIDEVGITFFGVSAPYIRSCQLAKVDPGKLVRGDSLRVIGSTGAPLTEDGFRWVYDHLPSRVQLSSASGGTDVCTAFLLSSPMHPTYLGRISSVALGVDAKSFDEQGHPVIGQMGELVITNPLPSMPIGFWNDPDRSRFHAAYFETFPGVWRHGDWVTFFDDGTCVIYGRSDSTLNRGGVRMGSAEFYRVVEGIDGVVDSLVIDTSALGAEGHLLLFVVAQQASDELADRIRATCRREISPRHVPDRIYFVSGIPKTLNGKKMEVPMRRLFLGAKLDEVASRGSVANPEALDELAQLAARYRAEQGPLPA
jgi:acetoacetyl-CoA synthetase